MIEKTKFEKLKIFTNLIHRDKRGYFKEILLEKKIRFRFPFLVMSYSNKNVLRGLHLQTFNSQGKFVSVIKGKILDVVVDCRKKSKTFGKHFKIILSEKNCKSIYIPKGFAHGFLCLDKENFIVYGCNNYRDKKSEIGVQWNDPKLKINWGIKKPILSSKDKKNKLFENIRF